MKRMAQVLSAKLDHGQAAALEQRSAKRRHLSLQVAGSIEAQENFNATVRDLSQTGFLMDSSVGLSMGEVIYVDLPRRGPVSAQVAWTDGHRAGCRFLEPISPGNVSAALLGSLPESRRVSAAAPAVQPAPNPPAELSRGQKLAIIVGLAILAWGALLGTAYAGLRLFHG
jgi:hypothetical protein